MAYTPPPPGKTEVGKPTPSEVAKQDVHIRDLPPEVRRSFLLSMVFFPGLVGAGICAILFLGWWFLREPKKSDQYARELQLGILAGENQRTRWQVAREIAENLDSPDVKHPAVLEALLEIVEHPEKDEIVDTWSPSDMIRKPEEGRTRLRWWAAYLSGHLAGVLDDPGGRGREVLLKTLNEENRDDPDAAARMRYYTAVGLSLLKDLETAEALIARMENDPDGSVRASCAKALGAIGFHHYASGESSNAPPETLERLRAALLKAYKDDTDMDVTWNTAIALARIKDPTGRPALESMATHDDPVVQGQAKKALALLEGKGKAGE